jgi:hypothetical protein
MFSDIHVLIFWRLSYIYSDVYVTEFLVVKVIFRVYEYIIRKHDKYIDKIVVHVLVPGITLPYLLLL